MQLTKPKNDTFATEIEYQLLSSFQLNLILSKFKLKQTLNLTQKVRIKLIISYRQRLTY